VWVATQYESIWKAWSPSLRGDGLWSEKRWIRKLDEVHATGDSLEKTCDLSFIWPWSVMVKEEGR
jgi:hypothetical protein